MQTPNHKVQLTLFQFILATDSGVVVGRSKGKERA